MAYEHREGSGSLFPNRDKKGDAHPDYKGDALFNGQRVELAAWKRQAAAAASFCRCRSSPRVSSRTRRRNAASTRRHAARWKMTRYRSDDRDV